MKTYKVALITGSAKRVGASIAKAFHQDGMNIVIHYNHSQKEAHALCHQLNQQRDNSAIIVQGNLQTKETIPHLIQTTINTWGRLDVLVNNAACFAPTALNTLSAQIWHETLNNNLTAPFLLSLEAFPYLKETQGCIINMVDIRATQPLKHYTPYCISKSGLLMATKALALEWAPDVRVNGIAPGVVLWPDEVETVPQKMQQKIIARTPLKRAGTPEDIAKTAQFLAHQAPYITGQIIAIDGGRSLAY